MLKGDGDKWGLRSDRRDGQRSDGRRPLYDVRLVVRGSSF